eukprot:CAMPEP_0204832988 /NCGR_PEP_ID=MMETSP1346-20131115/15372_1 /ASSEMBLY_ACC=CAM_ASM_000771 /TAXON_ID=215587 /ORGANISM="Aplanochytrium stocchinoi, Strain GSBS06" /LENGTH=731 /DNA_ID=CAMNT_0051965175 /DNA_START=257 /DNA_END=2452 /DNA_ORIENTATION=-
MDVIAVCPSIMMSCSLAFSIDYSLFLLSRYREEVMAGVPVRVAVEVMVDCAGHTIFVSGLTIAVCWFGMMAFPVSLLSTSGLGSGTAVLVTLLVNITLTPTMLLTFEDFFSKFYPEGLCNFKFCRKARQEDEGYSNLVRQTSAHSLASPFQEAVGRRASSVMTSTSRLLSSDNTCGQLLDSDMVDLNNLGNGKIDPNEEIEFLRTTTVWYNFAERCFGTKIRALIAVLICCGAILPLTPYAVAFHHSENFKLFSPRGSESAKASDLLADKFGGGRIAPYNLLIRANDTTNVLSNQFFEHVQGVIQTVLLNLDYSKTVDAVHGSGIEAPMYVNGHNVSLFPSGDMEKHLSVAECFVEKLEDVIAVCANDHCGEQVEKCENDKVCSRGFHCAENCEGDVECTALCFASIRDTDFRTLELAFCVTEHCLPRPFYLKHKQYFSQTTISQNVGHDLPTEHDKTRPDCTSVLLQFAQQIKFVKEPHIHVSKFSWMSINLNIAPFSAEGSEWLEKVRDAFGAQSQKDGYEYFLGGGDVAGHDMVQKVFDVFPVVAGGILTAVALICAFTFRSVIVPLRAVFTICLTLIFIYGTGVLVYEHHILDWTHFSGFSNPGGSALAWLTAAMIFPISVGLSLDYDIFLLTRVFEYRRGGFNDHDSILCGLSQTGSVITAAGLVMAVAFSGLILSSNPTLNQMAWFLVGCVLVDTFVVRTIAVPAMMILLQDYNWWPSKIPVLDY